jgi:hypothetical protein
VASGAVINEDERVKSASEHGAFSAHWQFKISAQTTTLPCKYLVMGNRPLAAKAVHSELSRYPVAGHGSSGAVCIFFPRTPLLLL